MNFIVDNGGVHISVLLIQPQQKIVVDQQAEDYIARWHVWLYAGLGNLLAQAKPWDESMPAGIVVL